MVTRLMRIANNARKIAEKAMRKMHVPAYCPVELGVQAAENRGVEVAWKKVISIMFMRIIVPISGDGVLVEGGIVIPPIALVGEPIMGIVVDMSIFILTGCSFSSLMSGFAASRCLRSTKRGLYVANRRPLRLATIEIQEQRSQLVQVFADLRLSSSIVCANPRSMLSD
jgi:hypothetical protein